MAWWRDPGQQLLRLPPLPLPLIVGLVLLPPLELWLLLLRVLQHQRAPSFSPAPLPAVHVLDDDSGIQALDEDRNDEDESDRDTDETGGRMRLLGGG